VKDGAQRTALVTGVTGQVGHYVAARLRAEGARVFGLVRRPPAAGAASDAYTPVVGDLLDEYSVLSVLERTRPDEVYNFAAQTFIPASWEQPMLTAHYTGLAVVRWLEAIRRVAPSARFLQAGSSEMFAGAGISPQSEATPVVPTNPYGVAKAFAFHTVRAYREKYGLFAANAVFFTNESPRRGHEFLFRKVTRAVARIARDGGGVLELGNLETVRDWGYTPDYAEGAVAIVRHEHPDDFVLATGQGHAVRELVERAFALVGLRWEQHVRTSEALHRASEAAPMVGDARRAREKLGWAPRVGFDAMVRVLLAHDLAEAGVAVPFEVPDAGG
jgi:GDPmannose 4,6-dehydratase